VYLETGNQFSILANTDEGRNIATVAIMPPCQPPTKTSIIVAVMRTGSGVNCPIAITSRSCYCVSHAQAWTRLPSIEDSAHLEKNHPSIQM